MLTVGVDFVPAPMTREALAWAAGFFDGEGNTSLSNRGQLTLQIGQSGDTELLDRFRITVGEGVVRGPYVARGGRKPVFVFSA